MTVTDRQVYVPTPVQSWAEVIAKKDEEIARLRRELEEARREQYVHLGRS